VAIDGYYRMAEDFPSSLIEKPAHVALEEGVLKIKALD
jgi:septum formation inhibitor MinC